MPTFRCLFLPHFYPRQLIYEEEEEEREKSLQCWVTATIVNRLFLSTAESAPESVERDGWLTEENHYHQCPGNSRLHLVSFFCRESMDALFWPFWLSFLLLLLLEFHHKLWHSSVVRSRFDVACLHPSSRHASSIDSVSFCVYLPGKKMKKGKGRWRWRWGEWRCVSTTTTTTTTGNYARPDLIFIIPTRQSLCSTERRNCVLCIFTIFIFIIIIS